MRMRLCLAMLAVVAGAAGRADAGRPNVILILADDVGLGNLGCTGGPFTTPHIDALARGGTLFSHCFAMPQCSPSRCVALTGRYPFRTGLRGNHDREDVLPRNEVMIPGVLGRAGYVTASVGKWHVGPLGPADWGFEGHFLFPGSGLYWRGTKAQSKRYMIDGREIELADGQYLPDLMHEHLAEFLSRQRDEPFFVYYALAHVHGQLMRTPDSDAGADDDQIYADNVEYMDTLVGRLVAELDRRRLRDDTLILFTGDNGTSGDHARRATVDGRPLSGHKLKLLEGGSRVPLIANWPGVTPAGAVVEDLVDFSDFFPTLVDLAGAEPPADVTLDGRSFAPRLRGLPGTPRDWVFVQLGDSWYVRDRGFKLTSDGELLDMSNAPFGERRTTDEAARERLQAILDELDPGGSSPGG